MSLILLVLLLAPITAGQGIEPDDPKIRVDVSLVRVPTRVVDSSGRPVSYLTHRNFRILEDGAEQEMAVYGENREQVYVALVVDTSISTSRHLRFLVDAAQRFAARFGVDDHLAVYEAGPEVARIQEFTIDRKALQRGLQSLAVAGMQRSQSVRDRKKQVMKTNTGRGGTLLYDALALVRAEFPASAERRVIIVLTDAWDSGSDTTFPELERAMLQGSEQLFSVIVKVKPPQLQPVEILRAAHAVHGPRTERPQHWTILFDLRAAHASRSEYERVANSFIGALRPEDRVSFTALAHNESIQRVPLGDSRPIPAGALAAWEVSNPAKSAQAAKQKRKKPHKTTASAIEGDKILLLTARGSSGPGEFLSGFRLERREVMILPVEEMQGATETRLALMTLLNDPQGIRKVSAQMAEAFREQYERRIPGLAFDSGGTSFSVEKGSDLQGVYQSIADQIRASYMLGYYTKAAPGRREIRVTVSDPTMLVESRRAVRVQ